MRATSARTILEMARQDERIVFVGSDLGFGAMEDMRKEFPKRFFMEGISEQYVMGMAAGLAMEGLIPFVVSIASFITRRCHEQLHIDVCLHNLPVRIVGNGGGLVYASLGPTHTAVEDWALMRPLPNLVVAAPGDTVEVRALLRQSLALPGPLYMRLGPAAPPALPRPADPELGCGTLIRPAGDVLIVSAGPMTHVAIAAADLLAEHRVDVGVLHIHTIAPLDQELLRSASEAVPLVVSLEEHCLVGGLGSAVSEVSAASGSTDGRRVLRLGLPRSFPDGVADRGELLAAYGLDARGVARSVLDHLPDRLRAERAIKTWRKP